MTADAAHRERWREGLRGGDRRRSTRSTRRARAARGRGLPLRRRSCAAPTSGPSPAQPSADVERSAPGLIFVGGTGRSGTHVIGRLLGRHPRFAGVPIESRFHCHGRGMPDLARRPRRAGRLRREAARTSGGTASGSTAEPRGLYNAARRAAPFDAALERFERRLRARPGRERAGGLFADLLWPLAAEEGKPGLVEMSSHNVREAQTLREAVPGRALRARFRDGRDVASSMADQDLGPRRIVAGIDWWAGAAARDRRRRARRRGRRRVRAGPSSSPWSLSTTSSARSRGSLRAVARLLRGR